MNATATKQIACGNTKAHGRTFGFQHHHASVDEVRRCFATEGGLWSLEEAEQAEQDTYDPDAAYERHLEDAGHEEAMLQEQVEAAMGVVPFSEAMRAAEAEFGRPQVSNPDGSVVLEAMAPETIYDGIYTVEDDQGHVTFRLRTQKADDDFMGGRQLVGYLTGADNDHDYTTIGHLTETGTARVWRKHQSKERIVDALRTLLADPEAAVKAVHCFACHRTLTVPASVHDGLGPECARKAAL